MCGDIGGSIGPWLAGLVSDGVQHLEQAAQTAVRIGMDIEQLGLKAGLLVCMIFPVCMLAMLLVLKCRFGREK